MWSKDIAAQNAAAGEHEPPMQSRTAAMEKRIAAIERRLDAADHAIRLLAAIVKRISR